MTSPKIHFLRETAFRLSCIMIIAGSLIEIAGVTALLLDIAGVSIHVTVTSAHASIVEAAR
jgi:hypothetical protein